MDKITSIRVVLLTRGHTVSSWARAHGYSPSTVWSVIRRHAGRGKPPRGRLARAIMEQIGS